MWTEQDELTLSTLNNLVKAHECSVYARPDRDDDDDADGSAIGLAVLTDVGGVAAATPRALDAVLDDGSASFAWIHVHDLRCLRRLAARVGMHEACIPVFSDRSCQSTQLNTSNGVLYALCFFRLINDTSSISRNTNSSRSGSADSRDAGADRQQQTCSMVKLYVYVTHGVLITCEVETSQPQDLPPSVAPYSFSGRRGAGTPPSEVDMGPAASSANRAGSDAPDVADGLFAPHGGAVAAVADRVSRCRRRGGGAKGGGSGGGGGRYARYGLGLAVVELFEEALRLQAPLAAFCLRGIAHHQRQLAALAATESTAADVLMHLKVRARARLEATVVGPSRLP